MMAHLTQRQKFSKGGDATILPQPNPLSPTERNQKVFYDFVGRMKHYLTGAEMPEWFVKDLILKKAEELGVELKAGGGRIGFEEGTKPVLPRKKFVELRIKYKTTHNNTEFAELLNENWKPAWADSFNKDNVAKRIKDAKKFFPDNFDYKGSHLERAVTEKKMIELWGEENYQKHKKNFSEKKLNEKYSSDLDYKKQPIHKRQAKSKRTIFLKKKKIEAMNPVDRQKFLDDQAIKDAERTRKKRGQTMKWNKNPRNFKSMLWADFVDRTYKNYYTDKSGKLKIKPVGLEPPPFKLSEESLKLIKSKPELKRLDMEKITLIDKNNKPFTWDTIESYVKEGNALNSKGKPMSWDEITQTYKIKEFINQQGLAQKINKATIPNYDPVKDLKRSGWNIAHNTSFNRAPWETHIAPWRANIQEGRARTRFLNLWEGSNKEFKEGKMTKKARFQLRKDAINAYHETMKPITEIKYSLGKKSHGTAVPIKELFKRAGLELNTTQTTKLSSIIQSIMNKQNSGFNIVDIARWGKAELSALDDIAGKIPSKALGAFGKVLKVAGIASIPLDVVPFVQARDLGVDKWGAVGGKNLAEMYVNLPGMAWEGGRWVKSKLQGKDHEWKLPYEAQFGQRATAKELRETSEEDLIKNITAQAEASKKIHAGQQIDTTWSDEKLNNQINKALELKKYYDSNPDVLTEKETIVDNTQEIEKPEKFGIYADQIKKLKI